MGLSPGTVATQMQRDIKASGMNPVSELIGAITSPLLARQGDGVYV